MISVDVPDSALLAVRSRAEEARGEEVCGVIIRGEHTPIDNISKEPARRFRMDGKQQMDAWVKWGREGDLIVYHSHPRSAAFPSDDDKWVITRSPDITFLIYSVSTGKFAAFRWNGFAIVSVQINRVEVSTQPEASSSVTS